MYILDVMEPCQNSVLSAVLPIVKNIMGIIQIVVPIALLISFSISFAKLSINPAEKDSFRKLLNKIIAAVIVFFLPILINTVLGIVGESTEFSSCWINAPDTIGIFGNARYVDE